MSGDSITKVDFHAHILPGADHGSDSTETSLTQLELAAEVGVTSIIATPHFYPHRHTLDAFIKRRSDAYSSLVSSYNGKIDIKLGAEVLLCAGLENLEGIEKLCIEGTDIILIELPFSEFRESYIDTVRRIQRRGLKVLLAHVDRYPASDIEKLLDVGVKYLQVNAEGLARFFKPKKILEWAECGYVVAIGSDIHGKDKKAYKLFDKVYRLPQLNTNVNNFSSNIFE